MTPEALLHDLALRGIRLKPDGDGLLVRPASRLTDADRAALRQYKDDIRRLILLDRIDAAFQPDGSLAYRDADGSLVTAKYTGASTDNAITVWCADGATRLIAAERVAFDWSSEAAELFEERLAIMLEAGIPECFARERAEACTCEHIERLRASPQ